MGFHFREQSPRLSSAKILTNQGKRLTIKYNPQELGKDFSSVHEFSQRQDVEQAFPYLSRRRKVHLSKVGIQARNGETHDYLVLRQGRKRFLFDTVESQVPDAGISEDRRRKSLSLTLVVPQQVMREKGYMPQDNEGLRQFQSRRDSRTFFATTEKEGYLAVRGTTDNPTSIENNTDFIQPIPAVVIQDPQDNILFTVRGGDGANHDERLSGMITTPFTMGHSDPSDFGKWRSLLRYGLKHAMYREAGEETALQKEQQTIHLFPPNKNGHGYNVTVRGILNVHRYYRIKPLGVVYKEDTPIDKVHAGVIFVAKPKRKNVTFVLNGASHEIHHVLPISQQDYQHVIDEKGLTPTSWDKPIMNAVFAKRR
ncbi:MAG TPA: hypothetical protein VEW42_01735 [Candidatus Eisenbacteria bacterium]|nr:hypothetical protein [Candidatus Eisenbacteria bacterium]